MSDKRTKKDEAQWLEQREREEPVKTDIIKQLRAEVRLLLTNQARLLEALLHADEAVRIYRLQILANTERLLKSDDISGFYWDNVDGWHRNGDRLAATTLSLAVSMGTADAKL